MVLVFGKPIPVECVRKAEATNVFEIDIARAWKEMGMGAGWNNEIAVELFVR